MIVLAHKDSEEREWVSTFKGSNVILEIQELDLDLVSDNSICSSKGICWKVNKFLGRDIVLLILRTAL